MVRRSRLYRHPLAVEDGGVEFELGEVGVLGAADQHEPAAARLVLRLPADHRLAVAAQGGHDVADRDRLLVFAVDQPQAVLLDMFFFLMSPPIWPVVLALLATLYA